MYPKNGLQSNVAFSQLGRPGLVPTQARNDESETGQFKSTLADGTQFPHGYAVIFETDGYRLPKAGDTKIDGVVEFGYFTTVQSGNAYEKNNIDVNFPVKKKGAITVVCTSLTSIVKGSYLTLDLSDGNLGKFKLATDADTKVAKVNKTFDTFGTAEVELLQVPIAPVETFVKTVVAGSGIAVDSTDPENPVVSKTA